jgi:short-subunit dehydrogenase
MTFADRYGPWAIITGASSGIGQAFAVALAARGLNLVLVARRGERLRQLAAELTTESRVMVETLEIDLAGPDAAERISASLDGKDVGLLVSNAGFGFKGPHHEQAPARLAHLVQVNALVPTLLSRAFAPRLIARGKGGIIMTGSVEGFMSSPWSAAYAATKAHVHALGEALWDELKPHGVDVLVLAPGATDTENLRLQGFDAAKMRGVMAPDDVATSALDNIAKGPIHIPGARNRIMVGIMGLIPRKVRTRLVGKGTRMAMGLG